MADIIFTNHARTRLQERKLLETMALETILYPDSSNTGKKTGTKEFKKRFDASTVTVIATQNNQQQWVILSCWIEPPFPGTKDYDHRQRYHAYKKAGFWKKLWITVKNQLGF